MLSGPALKLAQELLTGQTEIKLQHIPQTRAGDELFAFLLFKLQHGREPTNNLIFNDVLYRLKTTDEILDPLRVFVSDKEFVKIFIKSVVGDEYNVPTLGILKEPNELETFEFPNSCCIKPTHASGEAILRLNGEYLDTERMKKWFSLNFYSVGREANYKNLRPKIIVEPLLFGRNDAEDYKVFCYKGKAKLIQVHVDRFTNHSNAIFDTNWNLFDFSLNYPKTKRNIPRPENIYEMILIAERIASYFDFIRVDIYSDGKACFVGEITNCHGNAGERFIPKEGEIKASQLIFSTTQ